MFRFGFGLFLGVSLTCFFAVRPAAEIAFEAGRTAKSFDDNPIVKATTFMQNIGKK